MVSTATNPNNAPTTGNFWNDAISNITKLFDSGAQVYTAVTNKTGTVATPKPDAAAPTDTIFGIQQNQFYAGAAIAVGVLVLVLVIKRK